MEFLEKFKPLGLFLLRLGVGVIFAQQGYIKLFVARPMFLKLFVTWGFPSYFAYVAGVMEGLGGILLILGLLTRLTGLLLAGEMAVALFAVHIRSGDYKDAHTAGLVLLLAVGSFALATVGPGSWSMDGGGGGGGHGRRR